MLQCIVNQGDKNDKAYPRRHRVTSTFILTPDDFLERVATLII
jgi:hypothetical protein